jgi:hypothetical protein
MQRVHKISPRARRIVFPVLAVVVATFISFLIHMFTLGTSAFPRGKKVDGHYIVEEHGRLIELTARQFRASYIHGIITVGVFVAAAITILVLYYTGDLKDEDHAA